MKEIKKHQEEKMRKFEWTFLRSKENEGNKKYQKMRKFELTFLRSKDNEGNKIKTCWGKLNSGNKII